ncbi:MAG: hypothetical protein ACM3U0_00845 [archaeon]
MKNLFPAILVSLAITSQLIIAQTKPQQIEDLTDSSRALQFQIGSNFSLSSFQGSVISYKHHFSRDKALRIGLSVYVDGTKSDGSSEMFTVDRDSLVTGSQNAAKRKENSIQLNTQFIWYLNPGEKLLIYGGAGPFLTYGYGKVNTENKSNDPFIKDKSLNEQKSSTWSPGVKGEIGVEWFAAQNISLLAEYGLMASYSWTETEITSTYPLYVQKSNNKLEGWNVRNDTVKFGVTLYFQ